jgi:XTP/dITP diphosphohydrolase
MKIVLASRNKRKVEEIKRMFSGFDIEFLTMNEFPDCPEVEEDGKTFRANAIKKAVNIAKNTGCPAIADDSGLEVFALGGEPGVLSARYAGVNSDDQNNVRKLLREMRNVKNSDRQARFSCCIALAFPDGRHKTFSGSIRGMIGYRQKGAEGFGYDPVFYPHGHHRTFAEMKGDEKDALSHRGRALRKLHKYLHNIL